MKKNTSKNNSVQAIMNEGLESVWVAIKSKREGIVGYLEKFMTPCGEAVSMPGLSRWIDGPVFDESMAKLIED